MKISYRLYLTVAPAILGVFLMAGLFYWGQYCVQRTGHRPIAGRRGRGGIARADVVECPLRRPPYPGPGQLARAGGHARSADELDRIAHGVSRRATLSEFAEAERADRERALQERTREYAQLLATIADDTAKRLEQVRLPLHILLENRFGDLNENQEEMLGAARTAAEAADADLVSSAADRRARSG